MVDYNKKKKRSFFAHFGDDNPDAILEEARFKFEDDGTPVGNSSGKSSGMAVDYVRRNAPANSLWAIICSVVGLAFLVYTGRTMIQSGTEQPLLSTALAACSLMWALAGFIYTIKSLKEKNMNYTISYISMALCALQLVIWIIIMVIGLR